MTTVHIDIETAQKGMTVAGARPGAVDGRWGRNTDQATGRFIMSGPVHWRGLPWSEGGAAWGAVTAQLMFIRTPNEVAEEIVAQLRAYARRYQGPVSAPAGDTAPMPDPVIDPAPSAPAREPDIILDLIPFPEPARSGSAGSPTYTPAPHQGGSSPTLTDAFRAGGARPWSTAKKVGVGLGVAAGAALLGYGVWRLSR